MRNSNKEFYDFYFMVVDSHNFHFSNSKADVGDQNRLAKAK